MNEKEQLFIKFYLENGNKAKEAAISAGYPENRAKQYGYELTHKNEEVMSAISKALAVTKLQLSDSEVSPDTIFEANISKALQTLATNTSDPSGAKVFFESFLKHKKEKEDKLGEYADLSTAELLRRVDNSIKELQEIKERMLATFGTETL